MSPPRDTRCTRHSAWHRRRWAETQAPSEQGVWPVGQLSWQAPPLHTWMPVHTVVHEPQCAAFEATQAPPQASRPALHPHWPAWQTWSAAQAFPQVPQFCASTATVLQAPPHVI